ncbi:MAG: hypothetical protein A2107_08180 [Verrucomicrobia bacterium GWF2_62_7]|nr:MAG: hypothetical protein A2107_08180 [Verrucomicrobia bacterium GWF2_62_7]
MNVIATDPSDLSPVTMLEVNQHLHRGDEVDESISAKILAATRSIELTVGPIMDSSWRATFDRVPKHHYIYLPAWLVTEISAVVAIDGDGVETPLAAVTDYVAELGHRPGRIRLVNPVSGGLRVDFSAGWESPAAVPAELKHAVLLEIGHMDAHREAVIQARPGQAFQELPRAIQHLTAVYAAAMSLAWGQA